MLDRHLETRLATKECVIAPLPSAPEPVPFQDMPGWSRGENVEQRHVAELLGEPQMVAALEKAPGWSAVDVARYRSLFAQVGGLMDVGIDRNWNVEFTLHNRRILSMHRSIRSIVRLTGESEAAPVVASIEVADQWHDCAPKTGKWIG